MGIPIVTLENSTKTLWQYRRNLAAAVAARDQRLVDSRLDDIAMIANFSEYPSVRAAAVRALDEHEVTLGRRRKSRALSDQVVPLKTAVVA